jgi:hypothetical protein
MESKHAAAGILERGDANATTPLRARCSVSGTLSARQKIPRCREQGARGILPAACEKEKPLCAADESPLLRRSQNETRAHTSHEDKQQPAGPLPLVLCPQAGIVCGSSSPLLLASPSRHRRLRPHSVGGCQDRSGRTLRAATDQSGPPTRARPIPPDGRYGRIGRPAGEWAPGVVSRIWAPVGSVRGSTSRLAASTPARTVVDQRVCCLGIVSRGSALCTCLCHALGAIAKEYCKIYADERAVGRHRSPSRCGPMAGRGEGPKRVVF